ncbi:unnamed protein product [Wuchereria bancrofti]|nr:unnamed protein product [Wuchereria bancrofti]
MYGGEKRKTAIVKKSLDPVFDNEFEFDLHFSDIENHMLIFTVKDAINYGPFSKPPVLGMVQIKLDSVKITEEFSSFWYDLKCS